MSSPVRRSLVLATVLALLLGVSGIGVATGLARQATATTVAGIDVDATTIPELQAHMDAHRLSSVQLVQFYLHRIAKLNPRLNAVITVSPTALADARAADRARRGGDDRPLLGIPVIVKDNINTTGMATTAGSWSLAGSTPSDAFIVERLKAAGAIVIGKANLSEWANFRSAPSSSGWSGIGGQTNMAYVLDRNPCGSSSGSGVVASADLATVTVGTETDGSIVCPSGANGVVGIKPTVGLASRAGIVPLSADQDTAGPMTRNVTDAAVVLGAMTGVDPDDAWTAGQAGHVFTDYTAFLDDEALEGARIGVWRVGTYDPAVSPEVHAALNAAVAALEAEGAVIVDPARILIEDAYGPEFEALLCEFKTDLPAYFSTYTGAGYPKTLQDVIDFNNANPDLEGPWNSLLFEIAESTGGRGDPACQAARATATSIARAAIDDLMAELDLDAIVAPTNGPAWVTDPVNGDLGGDFSTFVGSSSPSAIAGYANVTVPMGYAEGVLPLGISFIGGQWDEPALIGFAYDFEQATEVRVPPSFIPSLE
ncbi:MAG TPA: amidase [Candidatus Limnocylindrales bacterium]|nr:amidase [Candidatus Limnocylindrales bacterium]